MKEVQRDTGSHAHSLNGASRSTFRAILMSAGQAEWGNTMAVGLVTATGSLPACRVSANELRIAVIYAPSSVVLAPRHQRGAEHSNFCVLSEGKRVFYVDPEITHRVLDLAVAEKDLDGTKIAGRPIDDRRLGSTK